MSSCAGSCWPTRRIVYDCIDDLAVFPYNQEVLRGHHERMLREAEVVACVSPPLLEECRQARADALKQAQARAATYADTLGLRVRRIVSISEGGAGMPVPMPRMAMKAEAFDGSTPVAAGESSVSVQLDVVCDLGR